MKVMIIHRVFHLKPETDISSSDIEGRGMTERGRVGESEKMKEKRVKGYRGYICAT